MNVARTDSSGTSSYLTDRLGSTVAIASSTGTIQTQYTYDPFGATTSTGGTSTNAYDFTGRQKDSSGLYYDRARYYSPAQQRFISSDPIGFGGGDSNLYGYAHDSPTNFTDPSGLVTAVDAAAACVGGAVRAWQDGGGADPVPLRDQVLAVLPECRPDGSRAAESDGAAGSARALIDAILDPGALL